MSGGATLGISPVHHTPGAISVLDRVHTSRSGIASIALSGLGGIPIERTGAVSPPENRRDKAAGCRKTRGTPPDEERVRDRPCDRSDRD